MEIDFDEWHRREEEAAKVRGLHFYQWQREIARLKRDRQDADALTLLYECIEATERVDKISGHGCPWARPYELAAMIHQRHRDFDAEVAVLGRYLREASERPGARAAVEARYRKAWRRLYGTDDVTIPPPAVPEGGLAQLLDREREVEKRKAEDVAQRFLAEPVLADDDAEASRRSAVGLPSHLLDKDQWQSDALGLAGAGSDASAVVDALLSRADRWGVVDPDGQVVDDTFAWKDDAYAVIDLRTGEEITPKFGFSRTELWLSAAARVDLRLIESFVRRLSPPGREMIMFWRIPGDIMDGKAELRLSSPCLD